LEPAAVTQSRSRSRTDFLRRTVEITETCAEVNGTVVFAPVKTKASRRTLNMPPFVVHMLSEHLAARGRRSPTNSSSSHQRAARLGDRISVFACSIRQ
jgi:hypothetical protein